MWKRIAKIFGILVFTLCLSIAALSYSVHQITAPEKIPELGEKFAAISAQQMVERVGRSELEIAYGYLSELCRGRDNLTFPYDGSIAINCRELENKTVEEIAQIVMGNIIASEIEKVYYENYTCGFFECWKNPENKLYYFSHRANQVFYSLAIYFGVASIFGAFLIAYAERLRAIRTVGICMIFTGIFYFFKFFVAELISKMIPVEGLFAVESVVEIISPLFDNFLYIFAAGAVLLAASFIAKRFRKSRK